MDISDLERFVFKVSCDFNYYTETGPARAGDRAVELEMLRKMIAADVDNKWTFKQLADTLHQYVHVANHYTVVAEKPAA